MHNHKDSAIIKISIQQLVVYSLNV